MLKLVRFGIVCLTISMMIYGARDRDLAFSATGAANLVAVIFLFRVRKIEPDRQVEVASAWPGDDLVTIVTYRYDQDG